MQRKLENASTSVAIVPAAEEDLASPHLAESQVVEAVFYGPPTTAAITGPILECTPDNLRKGETPWSIALMQN